MVTLIFYIIISFISFFHSSSAIVGICILLPSSYSLMISEHPSRSMSLPPKTHLQFSKLSCYFFGSLLCSCELIGEQLCLIDDQSSYYHQTPSFSLSLSQYYYVFKFPMEKIDCIDENGNLH